MQQVPRDRTVDSSLALLRDGYECISKRCRRLGSDVFETRLLGQPAICMRGAEAARVFYEQERFMRRRALPPTALTLLQDRGSVALLDGAAHRHRKALFLDVLGPGRFDRLVELFAAELGAAGERWQRRDAVVVHDAAQEALCRAVCTWAGVPLAWHRELDGELLDVSAAAVELIDVLRPTVAVAVYVVFAALALHEHPGAAAAVRAGGAAERERFVQEVRRFYPFFPFVGGRVTSEFEGNGIRFPRGRRVLLDLYGNHDPRAWREPERFDPERFRGWTGDPYTFIPQGGGDHPRTHRCPGEWITVALTAAALEFLTSAIAYEVPEQDLRIDPSRAPALPASRFVIRGVRARE